MKYQPDFSHMRKYTIWSSDIGKLSDWEDFLEDEGLLEAQESIQRKACVKLNKIYLEDEFVNLNVDMPGQIVAIGDRDFSVLGSNLNQILEFSANEYAADEYNLYADTKDGPIVFRFIPDEVDPRPLFGHIYLGDCTPNMISEYTQSLRPYAAAVYGWMGEQASLDDLKKQIAAKKHKTINNSR